MSVCPDQADSAADVLLSEHDGLFLPSAERDAASPPVDDRRIAGQLARSERWRYPTWPLVCEAAERHRQRRRHDAPVEVRVAVAASDHRGRLRWFRWFRRYGWAALVSLLLHAGLMVWLGGYAIEASIDPGDDVLYVISEGRALEPAARRPEVLEIAVPEAARVRANGPFSGPASAPSTELDPGVQPPAVALASFADASSGPVGEVFALFGAEGKGLSTEGTGRAGAEFFGVRAEGRRFVFVVDSSRSMTGTKWRDATRELLAALDRLKADQEFYVIFFDGQSHRMFDAPPAEARPVPADAENIERFGQWMATVELGLHTRPAASVRLALELEPDAIYLLSDGEFEDQTAALLRERNQVRVDGRRAPEAIVHTIGFHSRHGQKVLQRIAKENGGRYVFVPPPPSAEAPGAGLMKMRGKWGQAPQDVVRTRQ